MDHPHRCARSRRSQQVAEPAQSVKRCADHRLCQPAELRAAAHRGRATPGAGELRTRLARLSLALQVSSTLRTGTPSVNDQAWCPLDIGPRGRQSHARARIACMRDIRSYVESSGGSRRRPPPPDSVRRWLMSPVYIRGGERAIPGFRPASVRSASMPRSSPLPGAGAASGGRTRSPPGRCWLTPAASGSFDTAGPRRGPRARSSRWLA
jgi:hypothetical protein